LLGIKENFSLPKFNKLLIHILNQATKIEGDASNEEREAISRRNDLYFVAFAPFDDHHDNLIERYEHYLALDGIKPNKYSDEELQEEISKNKEDISRRFLLIDQESISDIINSEQEEINYPRPCLKKGKGTSK